MTQKQFSFWRFILRHSAPGSNFMTALFLFFAIMDFRSGSWWLFSMDMAFIACGLLYRFGRTIKVDVSAS